MTIDPAGNKHPYGTDPHLLELICSLQARVAALEARIIAPEADGWITNGYEGDDDTLVLLREEFGDVRVGEPRPTHMRDADALKADGICGIYVVRQ